MVRAASRERAGETPPVPWRECLAVGPGASSPTGTGVFFTLPLVFGRVKYLRVCRPVGGAAPSRERTQNMTKIVALVVLKDGGEWDVSFHKSKQAANKHAGGLTIDDQHPGWVVEKLEDITAEDNAMSIEHLNSFIKQYISEEKMTDVLADAQNTVWGYLAAGGQETGTAAPENAAEVSAAAEQGEGQTSMAGKDTRKRPARRDKKATKASPKKKAAAAKKAKASKGNGKAREVRVDSKVARVIEMMKRKSGATVADIAKELGWETKSVHGVISGVLRKKMDLYPTVEKTDKGNVYRLPA